MIDRLAMGAGQVVWRRAAAAIEKADWDESQHPRDEDGRFASGVAREDQLGVPNERVNVHDAAWAWSGGDLVEEGKGVDANYKDIRSALAHYGKPDPNAFALGATLVKAANAAPPTAYPLYRGIGLKSDSLPKFDAAFANGKTVDLNLSSWTKTRDLAETFASGLWHTGVPKDLGREVIFRLVPGAHAYDATNDIDQGPQYTEHLTAGRFEVVSTEHSVPGGGGHWSDPIDEETVVLRQVATLDPDQLVRTKVASLGGPPEFQPWLESYMEQRMVPAKEAK